MSAKQDEVVLKEQWRDEELKLKVNNATAPVEVERATHVSCCREAHARGAAPLQLRDLARMGAVARKLLRLRGENTPRWQLVEI